MNREVKCGLGHEVTKENIDSCILQVLGLRYVWLRFRPLVETLFVELEAGGNTVIVRGSWLKEQSRSFLLPKRGDPLPPEATIGHAPCRHGARPGWSFALDPNC